MRAASLLVGVVVCLAPAAARAQDGREVTASYSILRNGGNTLHGWDAEGGVMLVGVDSFGSGSWGALAFEVNASSHTGDAAAGGDERRTTVLVGARVFGGGPKTIQAYVRAGFGYSYRSTPEAGRFGALERNGVHSPVVRVGTGLQIPVRKNVVLRPISIDYMYFPTDRRARHGLQLGFGVGIWW